MPHPPPRPLCLPELVSNPQTRADYVQSNPPKYGPASRPHSCDDTPYDNAPSSPTSYDGDSHRASAATLASLTSPVTTASTRTSLSVHNMSWNGDAPKRSSGLSSLLAKAAASTEGKSWGFSTGAEEAADKKPRSSWSSAFANTKTWFAGAASPEASTSTLSTPKHSSQMEIKLSPSMIAASALTPQASSRPQSSPLPLGASRSPRVGTGLQYYTERNPAPANIRVQIRDPVDIQDGPPCENSGKPPVQGLAMIPDVTVHMTSPIPQLSGVKDLDMSRGVDASPLSPPLTPLVPQRESNVPHIRVSFGGDL